MTATHTYPITTEEWIRAWLDLWVDEPHWRFGFTETVLVGALAKDWGPWMVDWDPRPGCLIVDGEESFSPDYQ